MKTCPYHKLKIIKQQSFFQVIKRILGEDSGKVLLSAEIGL